MQREATPAPQEEGKAPLKPPPSTSQNDSGYSSVLTSPEFSREACSQHKTTAPEGVVSFTPEVTGRITTRLTSTPHTSSSQDVFRLPLPRIDSISKVGRNRYNSTSDSPITTTTPTSLEMHELEMTCEVTTNQKPQKVKARSPEILQTPSRTKVTVGHRIPTSRAITRLRKPQSAFVRLLKEADYLLRRVLKYLSGEDLLCLSHVNQQLRDLILKDKMLGGRRTSFLQARKTDRDSVGKENFKLKRLNEGNSAPHRTLSPRKQLSAIQNLCGSSSSTNRSPEKVPPLAERFIEEGKNIGKGGELQKCVKCKSPALVQKSQQRATCSRKTCGYDYCTNCHLPLHRRPQECPVLKPRTRQAAGIFSNRCKKNLRRL